MSFVVNMIPNIFSGEQNQDSEPNLAIDPADPRRIAGSAFTPDPLGGANAPIFVVDRRRPDVGRSRPIVPSTGRPAATGDISVAYGHEDRLYAGSSAAPAVFGSTSFARPIRLCRR